MSSQRGRTAAVIGDINLDVIARLPDGSVPDTGEDVFVPSPMTVTAAGTAVGFARAATPHFRVVHLFGRIGGDAVGDAILSQLTQPGIALHVARDTVRPSRVVVIIREGDGAGGRRVMIPRTEVANSHLADADISALLELDPPVDVALVDGYSYLFETSRATVARAALELAERGVPVAFDVVPHDLHRKWSLRELTTALEPATFLIAEVVTLLRFLGRDDEPQSVDEVCSLLPELCSVFGRRVLMLRFGMGQIDQSLVVWSDGSWRHQHTGYANAAEPAGFGDRLTAQELAEALNRRDAG